MSGAQPKAAEIAGGVSVTAEVDRSRIETRHAAGLGERVSADLDEVFPWSAEHAPPATPLSIAYHGNVVDLWQYMLDHEHRRRAGLRPDLVPRRLRGRLYAGRDRLRGRPARCCAPTPSSTAARSTSRCGGSSS